MSAAPTARPLRPLGRLGGAGGLVLLALCLTAASAHGAADAESWEDESEGSLRSALRAWADQLGDTAPSGFLAGHRPLWPRSDSTVLEGEAEGANTEDHAPKALDYLLLVIKFGLIFVWFAVLTFLSTEGARDQESARFLNFELHAQILARSQLSGAVNRWNLRFADPEMERRYKDIWREVVVLRIKWLCVVAVLFLFVLTAFSTGPGGTGWNPVWGRWGSSTAALTHNLAVTLLVVLCLVMFYAVTWKKSMMESDYLDFIIVSWIMTIVIIGNLFVSRWAVCRLHGEDTENVFGSVGFDEEYVFGLIGIALYVNVFTPMRFCVLMPCCLFFPVFYTLVLAMSGLPHDSPHAPVVAMECCAMLALIAVAALMGKYLSESDRRTNFLRMHNAYSLEQELIVEKEEGSTPMLQARSALGKAVEALQVIQETPGIAELIGRQVQTAKDRVVFAQKTLSRVDNLFDIDADDIVNQASVCADLETKEFIKTAFLDARPAAAGFLRPSARSSLRASMSAGGPGRRSLTGRGKTVTIIEPLHSVDVTNSVPVVSAAKWAGLWGTSWDFDALEVAKLSGNCSVVFAGERALVDGISTLSEDHQPKEVLGCGKDVSRAWLRSIHGRYLPNAYHNEAHASQVAHICVFLAHVSGWVKFADPVQLSALVIAAFAHDVGHFGRNNLFCAKTWNASSILWNDRSVLENMHAAICFAVSTGGADIFEGLESDSRNRIRQLIVRFILSTDIKEHHSFMSRLHAAMADEKFLKTPADDDAPALHDLFEDHVIMGGELLIKTSDIAHSLLPWKMHREWSLRVNIEFWEQGDEEQQLGLPISPLCDRTDVKLASGQNFFITHFGKGMLGEIKRMMNPDSPMMKEIAMLYDHGDNNVLQWKAEEKTIDPATLSLTTIREKFGQPASEVSFPYQISKDNAVVYHDTKASLAMAAAVEKSRYTQTE